YPATHGLLTASPAINAYGPPCGVATDQRGVTRPQGPTCDIGAYEKTVVVPPPPPNPTADLSIDKTALPEPVTVGDTLVYTLTVNNLGPDSSDSVVVTDTLPGSV